jgi:hypothetical protein
MAAIRALLHAASQRFEVQMKFFILWATLGAAMHSKKLMNASASSDVTEAALGQSCGSEPDRLLQGVLMWYRRLMSRSMSSQVALLYNMAFGPALR